MSHAMETCELDSPICKLSGALMLLVTGGAGIVSHCHSTAVGQSLVSQLLSLRTVQKVLCRSSTFSTEE